MLIFLLFFENYQCVQWSTPTTCHVSFILLIHLLIAVKKWTRTPFWNFWLFKWTPCFWHQQDIFVDRKLCIRRKAKCASALQLHAPCAHLKVPGDNNQDYTFKTAVTTECQNKMAKRKKKNQSEDFVFWLMDSSDLHHFLFSIWCHNFEKNKIKQQKLF